MTAITADDGCKLHYEATGEGEPVVLIPGLGGDGRFWASVVKALAGRFRTIAVDHRGAGRSDRPEGGYTIGRIGRDVLHVLDAEGIPAAHLVGHSTGGTVVQTLGLEAPERAKSLTISGSWARPDARFRALFASRLETIEKGEARAYQHLTHVLGYTAEWIEAHEAELSAAAEMANETLAPFPVAAARIRMLLAFDRAAELGRISAPVLLLGGTDDIMVPFHHTEELAQLIGHAKLKAMTGGHFYPRVAPQAFAQHFSEFIETPNAP